ncbi:MAG: hypothetical protein NPIRA06_33500 [Nitrospirales bacterium]|nr:MAG: hypothetical protein NPIRA06_33500 [Nitrospirales bacterium]
MAAMVMQVGMSQRLERSLFNQFDTQAGMNDLPCNGIMGIDHFVFIRRNRKFALTIVNLTT